MHSVCLGSPGPMSPGDPAGTRISEFHIQGRFLFPIFSGRRLKAQRYRPSFLCGSLRFFLNRQSHVYLMLRRAVYALHLAARTPALVS